jgi:hypothetical protein
VSGRIVGEVLNHAPTDLRPTDLLVLISLAESAHDKDRTARNESSCEAIAYRVRSTPGNVRQCLLRLKRRGLIRPVHDIVGRGRAQDWTITQLSDYHREGATWTSSNGGPTGTARTAETDQDPSPTARKTRT